MRERLRRIRAWLGEGIVSRALFALLLAILLWGWVTTQDDPEIEQIFPGIVPLLTNKAPDLILADQDHLATVTITVRGPQSEINRLTTLDLPVEVNLAEITGPTSTNLPIVARVIGHRSVQIVKTTPETMAISVDRLVAKSFPLEVEKGTPILPYSIGNVEPQQQQVTLRGPQKQLDQVTRVVLPIALGDHRDSFDGQFTPEPRNSAGTRVNGLTINPGNVTASVTVERIGRTVSIVPNIQGSPADGYRVETPRISPPSVTIDGPPEVIGQLIVISTAPIDVSGRRASFSVYDVTLNLPAGTRVLERNTVNVEITINAEVQQQQIGGVKVNIQLDPGLRATVTPSEISVVLSGPRERIRQLSAGEVTAEIDLRGKGPGTYSLTPTINKPPELSADPAQQVRVVVEPIPATPTPTPRPTPTPVLPPPTPSPGVSRP